MAQEIRVPDIGDFKNVEVIDVLVKAGDTIAVETPLITLETDKATIDVPASAAGIVKSVAVKKGDRVSKDSLVVTIEAQGTPSAAKPTAAVADDTAFTETIVRKDLKDEAPKPIGSASSPVAAPTANEQPS